MAEANIGELGTMPLGSIRIAAPLGLGRRLVADTAAAYRDKHPKIDVQLRLSERRAKAVADAMVGLGVPQTIMNVDWKGKTDLAVQTPDGVKEPLNRRSTISINF